MNNQLTIRFATENDSETVLEFIKALAIHVNALDHVTTTKEDIKQSIFIKKQAEVILGFEGDVAVGFALFFHNYSSFVGNYGLFLEDLFVLKSARGKGYGKALLLYLAKLASERGCSRMDWNCLDWNKGSRDFYESLGAVTVEGQLTYRFDTDRLNQIVKEEL